MPDTPASDIARNAAAALSGRPGLSFLSREVDACLRVMDCDGGNPVVDFGKVSDVATVANLIVAMAGLAWMIHHDSAGKAEAKPAVEIEKRLTIKFRDADGYDSEIVRAVIQALEGRESAWQ
ncbi:MAG: hypothetical protein HQL42_16550 [Alphaproteobacteria bacterium]|nr:hypothetical protein [Alphaproteobacteria bacterium]